MTQKEIFDKVVAILTPYVKNQEALHAVTQKTHILDELKVSAWGDMPVWVPGTGDTAGFSRRSNASALGAGLTFRPIAATAVDTLRWWKSLPADRQAKLRSGIAPEREQQVLAAWKAKKSGACEGGSSRPTPTRSAPGAAGSGGATRDPRGASPGTASARRAARSARSAG